MIFKRPLTETQKQHLIDKLKPSQEAVNAASSDLHEYEMTALNDQADLNQAVDFILTDLMTRVAALEGDNKHG